MERFYLIPVTALLIELSKFGCENNGVDNAVLNEEDAKYLLNNSEYTYDERVTCSWHAKVEYIVFNLFVRLLENCALN